MRDTIGIQDQVSGTLNGVPIEFKPFIYCKEKAKPEGCQLPNIFCNWPACNTPDLEPDIGPNSP